MLCLYIFPAHNLNLSLKGWNLCTFLVWTALAKYHFLMKAEGNIMLVISSKLRPVIKAKSPYQNQRITKIFSDKAFGARTQRWFPKFCPPASPNDLKLQVAIRGKIISRNSLALSPFA